MFKTVKHVFEAILTWIYFRICYLLPIEIASSLSGKFFTIIGPLLKANHVAYINLSKCFPNFSETKKKEVLRQMWDNLGRSIGEMPHWQNMDSKKFFEKVIINDCSNGSFVSSKAHLYLSGHYGNWELFPKLLEEYNLKPALVYRPANNPYVDKLINQSRAKKGISLIKKGKNGIREIITRLQNSGSIGMLIDQKTNDGIEVPFFGFMVKTTPAPANLALKFKAEIILTCVRRVKGANYSINIFPPLQITDDDNTLSIMHEINQNLEKWIREDPSQWFWVHKRWPKEWYKD